MSSGNLLKRGAPAQPVKLGVAPQVLAPPLRDARLYANAPSVAERRTVPLPKEDLVNYIASGCKPKDKWRSVRM